MLLYTIHFRDGHIEEVRGEKTINAFEFFGQIAERKDNWKIKQAIPADGVNCDCGEHWIETGEFPK